MLKYSILLGETPARRLLFVSLNAFWDIYDCRFGPYVHLSKPSVSNPLPLHFGPTHRRPHHLLVQIIQTSRLYRNRIRDVSLLINMLMINPTPAIRAEVSLRHAIRIRTCVRRDVARKREEREDCGHAVCGRRLVTALGAVADVEGLRGWKRCSEFYVAALAGALHYERR